MNILQSRTLYYGHGHQMNKHKHEDSDSTHPLLFNRIPMYRITKLKIPIQANTNWHRSKILKVTLRRAAFAFCCWFFPDHWTASIKTSHKIRTISVSGNLASLTRSFTVSITSDISASSVICVVKADFISLSVTSNIFFSLYSTKAVSPSLLKSWQWMNKRIHKFHHN